VKTGDFAEAYLTAGFKVKSREDALVKAQRLLARIDAATDYLEIFHQFAPSPFLAAHMSDIAFQAKDPNLRHRGQKLIADCLGWTEKKEQPAGGGFQINILSTAPTALQVKAGDSIKQIDGDQEKPQRVEPGKPISFLK
jgi:hypothetical protein